MLEQSSQELVLKIVEENQGIDLLELTKILQEGHSLSCSVSKTIIQELVELHKIRIIKVNNQECCYLYGNTKSNQQYYKNRKQSYRRSINSTAIIGLLILLAVTLCIVFPILGYFAVILLFIYGFIAWLCKK